MATSDNVEEEDWFSVTPNAATGTLLPLAAGRPAGGPAGRAGKTIMLKNYPPARAQDQVQPAAATLAAEPQMSARRYKCDSRSKCLNGANEREYYSDNSNKENNNCHSLVGALENESKKDVCKSERTAELAGEAAVDYVVSEPLSKLHSADKSKSNKWASGERDTMRSSGRARDQNEETQSAQRWPQNFHLLQAAGLRKRKRLSVRGEEEGEEEEKEGAAKKAILNLGPLRCAGGRPALGLQATSMWPTWRRLALLSLISVLLTSLLVSLDLDLPLVSRNWSSSASSSPCHLFNYCHALSVAGSGSASNQVLATRPQVGPQPAGSRLSGGGGATSSSTTTTTTTGGPPTSVPHAVTSSPLPGSSSSTTSPNSPLSTSPNPNPSTTTSTSAAATPGTSSTVAPPTTQSSQSNKISPLNQWSSPLSSSAGGLSGGGQTMIGSGLRLRPSPPVELAASSQLFASAQASTSSSTTASPTPTSTQTPPQGFAASAAKLPQVAAGSQGRQMQLGSPNKTIDPYLAPSADYNNGIQMQKFSFNNNYQVANNNRNRIQPAPPSPFSSSSSPSFGSSSLSSSSQAKLSPAHLSAGRHSTSPDFSRAPSSITRLESLPLVAKSEQRSDESDHQSAVSAPGAVGSEQFNFATMPSAGQRLAKPHYYSAGPASPLAGSTTPLPMTTSASLGRQQPHLSWGRSPGDANNSSDLQPDAWSTTSATTNLNEPLVAASTEAPARQLAPNKPTGDLQRADSRRATQLPLAQVQPPPPPTPSNQQLAQLMAPPLLLDPQRLDAAAGSRQQEARSQFLVSAGLAMPQALLHSMVRDAITDLMQHGEQIFGSASASRPLVLRPHALLAPIGPLEPQAHLVQAQRQPANSEGRRLRRLQQQQQQQQAASHSAPSVSLPPLSHFLAPRNPFRLFSSSSAPMAARYRPSFIKSSKQPPAPGGKLRAWTSFMGARQTPAASASSASSASSGRQQQHEIARGLQPASAFQGSASLAGLDDTIAPTITGSSLYAHSHSAEQLERLVRAASQATGVRSPILPAIVSAPTGAFPGFYIPALESDSEESQVSELRHGEPTSITSKIPGTDYILHPDEVRAMINIGELAWRQQQSAGHQEQQQQASASMIKANEAPVFRQQQQQQQSQQQQQATHDYLNNWHSFGQRNQPSLVSSGTQNSGFMRENHAENVRDFAYVDQRIRRDHMQGAQSSMNAAAQEQQSRAHGYPASGRANSSELESHLANHFKRERLNSFPAIIRVNDQDYVHWPLIKADSNSNNNNNQQHGHSLMNGQAIIGGSPRGSENVFAFAAHPAASFVPAGAPIFPLPFAYPAAATAASHRHQHRQPAPWAPYPAQPARFWAMMGGAQNKNINKQMVSASTSNVERAPQSQQSSQAHSNANQPGHYRNQNQNKQSQADLEHSPVRLATQLTPSEVRQVEDSIIEALIMAQTLQHQRKLMDGLAMNQNQLRPVFSAPGRAIHGGGFSAEGEEGESSLEPGTRLRGNRLFRRRRRRRNSSAAGKQQQQELEAKQRTPTLSTSATNEIAHLHSAAPAQQHLVSTSSLAPSALNTFSDPHTLVVGPSLMVGPNHESLVFESKADLNQPRSIPVLLADQETNKPNLLRPESASRSNLLNAESSAPKVAVMKPAVGSSGSSSSSDTLVASSSPRSPATITSGEPLVMAASSSSDQSDPDDNYGPEGQAAYGRRVRLNSSNGGRQVAPQARRGAAPSSSLRGLSSPSLESSETRSSPGGNRGGPSNSYRDVDWPTMVSDADYFPSQDNRNQHKHRKPGHMLVTEENSSENHRDEPVSGAGHHRDSSEASSDLQHRELRLRAQPSHPLKNYVTSQLKLQFAQDYQAREGVPIYNNNVRVAGALDRQRSGESRAASNNAALTEGPRRNVPSSVESSEGSDGNDEGPDESDESDGDEGGERAPGEMQQGGTNNSPHGPLVAAASKQSPVYKEKN